MPKVNITRTELVWPGKYDDDGNLVQPRRVNLPFQVIERVNETRATRAQREKERAGHVGNLFDYWNADEKQKADGGSGWRNKLIWGDNLYMMGSLLEKYAGKIDLIYIDPPFATGADFSFDAKIGNEEIVKEHSSIEEKAYRDTWGRGIDSYLAMMYDRLRIMRDLLSDSGSIYVHLGWQVSASIKAILDEVFGPDQLLNEIIWKRQTAKGGSFDSLAQYGRIHETIYFYSKTPDYIWNLQYTPYSTDHIEKSYRHTDESSDRRFSLRDLTAAGTSGSSGFGVAIAQ